MNFEKDKSNNKLKYNFKKKKLAEIRRHSISFNKEYFDFFESERYLGVKESQGNSNNKEDLNDRIFTMFLFFSASFVLYTITFILIQTLKLTLFPNFDVLQNLTEVISYYDDLTANLSSNPTSSNEALNNLFGNPFNNLNNDFEHFQKKFKVFEFLGIEVK